jgi:hypothetical protein
MFVQTSMPSPVTYSLRIAVLAAVAVLTFAAALLYALPGLRVLLLDSTLGMPGSLAAIVLGTLLLAFAVAWTAMFIREHRHGHWSHIQTPRH